MASSLTAVLLLFLCELSASEEPQEIRVKPGHDATLPCRAPPGASVTLLEWTRPDLLSDSYVFLYRNKRSYQKYQHPRFSGRVELRDPEMQHGDVSVVLKAVGLNDTGTYECQVLINITGSSETNPETTKRVLLTVTDSGHTAVKTDVGLIVGLSVGVLLLLLVIVIVFIRLLIVKKTKAVKKQDSYRASEAEAGLSMT